jgi:hypothetical protein
MILKLKGIIMDIMSFPAMVHVLCPECGVALQHARDDTGHYMIHTKLAGSVCSLAGKNFEPVQVEMKERSA